MKKMYVLLTIGILAFGMTACGNDEKQPEQTQTVETQTEATGETATQETETVTENTGEATNETGEQSGTADTTNGWSEEMSALRQKIVEALGENYWPDMQVDAETLEMIYGITPDMYDDYLAEMPMMSTNVDTLLIIKAKDDKVEAVENAMNAYRDALVGDTMQYPTNLGKIQASRIQTYGKYVCFVQLGGPNLADENRTEEESLTQCQEQNEMVLELIGKSVPQE